jgi:cytochrome c-type biogenesis protein
MTQIRKIGRYVRWGAGLVLIVMGWAMATGELARFAIWVLKTFPVLGQLG